MGNGFLNIAKDIATIAHQGQFDKAGKPYIFHPQAVASMVDTDEEKAVAWLHDTIEDSDFTEQDLIEREIPQQVVDGVIAMTKVEGEEYSHYLHKLKNNDLARKVKMADLIHNCDLSRISNPTEKDRVRIEKYKKAMEFLKS